MNGSINRQTHKTGRGQYALWLVGMCLLICLSFALFPQKNANAAWYCNECQCVEDYHGAPNPYAPGSLRLYIYEQHILTQEIFGTAEPIPNAPYSCTSIAPIGSGRLGVDQVFIIRELFLGCGGQGGILPALMMMTEQFVSIMMHQAFMVGTFFDAKQQLETQLLFQDLMTQAHKDYHPSLGMCVFGTNIRSMGAASFNAAQASYSFSQRALERELGSRDVNAAEGPKEDRGGRLAQVERRFCDRYDNNATTQFTSGLTLICDSSMPPTEFANADIDYTRIVDLPTTLEMDFANNNNDRDEIDVMALASNLYAHDVFERTPETLLGLQENETLYLDLRSVIAKRAVAENSFSHIVGMKTQGSETDSNNTAQYMQIILQELGIPDQEIPMYLGDLDDMADVRPSYMAQLEILGKLIYQNPSFYTDLYDKPENVERKKTAMRAINSIIQREIYESQLRSENLMSLILEHSIMKQQQKVQNIINNMNDSKE